MNYLGAEPARYQIGSHTFLVDMEFILECPPLKGAMGDDLLSFTTRNGHFQTQEVIPLLTPFASPFKGGLSSFPTLRVGGLNHL
ncbi:hypothetical protein DYD21_08165 [Rhodohalobacter sp. SW132]|nr:hypothetical protein DYD21_08165 [Rhodohalobacter sp. SW132]